MDEDNFYNGALIENNHGQLVVPGNRDGEPENVNQGDGGFGEPLPEPAPSFTLLKMYLRVTGLWYPSKAAVYTIVQLTILGGLIFIYFYQLDVLGIDTMVDTEFNGTVTIIKNFIWLFRMPVMYVLGMSYFPKCHLDKLLQEVNLTAQCWRMAKKSIDTSFFVVIVLAFVVPLSSMAIQMMFYGQRDTADPSVLKQILMRLVFSSLARFFSLPMVFVFILVVCVISSDIRQFKEQIQEWPAIQKEEARNRFIDIKRLIQNAQEAFQPFLVTQLVFLCVVLLPSIFSVVERFETAAYQNTLKIGTYAMDIPAASRSGIDTDAILANFKASTLQLKGDETPLNIRPPPSPVINSSLPQVWAGEGSAEGGSLSGIIKVLFEGLSDFLEMFIVYNFPLVLLARLHNKITSLPEVVQNLKFSEQIESGSLFQDKKVLKEMLKEFSSGKGIQILRMNLTGVKAVFITLLMPFLTTTINLLILHVKVKS